LQYKAGFDVGLAEGDRKRGLLAFLIAKIIAYTLLGFLLDFWEQVSISLLKPKGGCKFLLGFICS